MLIDSHCHLDYFTDAERPDVLARAAAAGVGEMVTIGTTLRAVAAPAGDGRGAAEPLVHRGCPSAPRGGGAGPDTRGHRRSDRPSAGHRHRRVRAGLLLRPFSARRAAGGFRAHIRAARLAGVPLAIHARDADQDIAAILQDERDNGGDFSFLLHCFSSSRMLAEAAVAMGGYVSFSGILTFPKSNELREIARDLPADRLLVETDAPYLAPVPFRGKRNEPAYVAHTARVLAEVRGLEPQAAGRPHDGEFPPSVPQGGLSAMRVILLGTGGSAGVPMIGGEDGSGDWGACDPAEPRNRRTRASIVVESDDGNAPAGGYLAGHARPVAGLPGAAGGRRPLHACACRPHHRPRRRADPEPHCRPAARRVRDQADAGRADAAVRLRVPAVAAAWLLPAGAGARARSSRRDDRDGRTCRCGCSSRIMASSRRSVCASAASAIRPTWCGLDDAAFAVLAGVDTWVVGCFLRRGPHKTHADLPQVIGLGAPHRCAADSADAHGHRHGLGLAAGEPAGRHRARP